MSDRVYWRPVLQTDVHRPSDALVLAGGWAWFQTVERLQRGRAPELRPATDLPEAELAALTTPRAPIAGLDWRAPRIMGILNVTPDSFSDGGQFDRAEAAIAGANRMLGDVDIIDIGGESTRPGAQPVAPPEEIARVAPVIRAIADCGLPISIDTRNAATATAALEAGAALVNDVSAMTHDPAMADTVSRGGAPVCLMHSKGDPQTMQNDPRYADVLLDVYDHLAERIAAAEEAGIPRARIIADPGIGFGKTLEHNLALLRRVALFHALGCTVLVGASRKRFIGTLGKAPEATARAPGSLAVASHLVSEGVQLLRVHDTAETAQALRLSRAILGVDDT